MAKEWTFSTENMKIKKIAGMIMDGDMVLLGSHQRELVWDSKMENSFINSLWRNIDVPKIYVLERKKNTETEDEFCEETYYESIDGQQRSNTIVEFLSDRITLFKKDTMPALRKAFDDTLEGKSWKTLSREQRSKLGHKEITVVVYDATMMSEEEIDELKDFLFQSLNISSSMNTQEKIRSQYRKTKLVQEIIRPLSTIDGMFYEVFEKIIPVDKIRRQDDGKVISVIAYYLIKERHADNHGAIATAADAPFYKYCQTNEDTIDWDDIYKKIVDAIQTLIEATEKCGGIEGTRFKKKASFISMVCVIIDLKSQGYKFNIDRFGDAISHFTSKLPHIKDVEQSGINNLFDSYVAYSQSGKISSRDWKNERHKVLVEFLKEHAPDALIPPKNKDYQRRFSNDVKTQVYQIQDGHCAICEEWKPFEEMEADHIIPHSEGGKTTRDNCQCACRDCNKKKGSKTNFTKEMIAN